MIDMHWVWVDVQCGGCQTDFPIQVPDWGDYDFVIPPLCDDCQDAQAIEMSNKLFGGLG